jgi:ABC-type bacteriocin/lantibiotic exporter with double-glycine peptidase domain
MVDLWVVSLPLAPIFPAIPLTGTILDWLSRARITILAFAAILVPIYIQRSYAEHLAPVNRPTIGSLVAKDLTARLSPEGAAVLHKVSFRINAGERIGVVGKVGSERENI